MRDELADPRTPLPVREWILQPPAWIEVRVAGTAPGARLDDLGAGETAALTLATELHADLVLIDDRQAVAVARDLGIPVTGTLGLLARAAQRGMIDLADSFERLKRTNFRYRQDTMDQFLEAMPDKD